MKTIILVLLVATSIGLRAQDRPDGMRPQSQNTNLHQALVLYGELSGRTVLRRTSLMNDVFAFKNSSTNRAEVLQSIEAALTSKDIAVILDGEKFVLIGPKSHQHQLVPRSSHIPATNSKPFPKGAIYLASASTEQGLAIYAALLGKKLDRSSPIPAIGTISLIQTTELSKEECLYAFETLIRWQGLKLVPAGDDAVKPVRVPREPDVQPAK